MPALGAAGMKQKIVKVPQNQMFVAFGRPQAGVSGADLEKDLAFDQQSEKLKPRKAGLSTQPFDLLRRRQHGQGGRDLRIANFEQGAGARRFKDHVAGAPPHIGEPRQHQGVGIAKLRRLRPIVGNLRFDDDEVLAALRASKAVFQ